MGATSPPRVRRHLRRVEARPPPTLTAASGRCTMKAQVDENGSQSRLYALAVHRTLRRSLLRRRPSDDGSGERVRPGVGPAPPLGPTSGTACLRLHRVRGAHRLPHGHPRHHPCGGGPPGVRPERQRGRPGCHAEDRGSSLHLARGHRSGPCEPDRPGPGRRAHSGAGRAPPGSRRVVPSHLGGLPPGRWRPHRRLGSPGRGSCPRPGRPPSCPARSRRRRDPRRPRIGCRASPRRLGLARRRGLREGGGPERCPAGVAGSRSLVCPRRPGRSDPPRGA